MVNIGIRNSLVSGRKYPGSAMVYLRSRMTYTGIRKGIHQRIKVKIVVTASQPADW